MTGLLNPLLRPLLRPLLGPVLSAGTGSLAAQVKALFAGGQQGLWFDPSDFSTLFQDSAGTIPVTATGQPVGLMKDKSGNNNTAMQPTSTSRPILQQDATGHYYLADDGVDDGMFTGNINFSASDKIFFCSGFRKDSDASVGTVAELSADAVTNNGVFAMYAPHNNATPGVRFRSRGTVSGLATTTSVAAPITMVGTGIGDISGDSCILRINGVVVATAATDQGTGNFGNYPLYIGSHGESSARLLGRIYGMVIVGAALSAASITSTERYMGAKTGVAVA